MRASVHHVTQTFSTIFKGMMMTLKIAMQPKCTLEYPDVKKNLPERTRGRLFNVIEDCIGCLLCAKACPTDCIRIDIVKREKDEAVPRTSVESGEKPIRFWIPKFDIDFNLCCWCGLCTDPCPTHCLTMTKEYEFSAFKKEDLVFHFAKDSHPSPKSIPSEPIKQASNE